MSSSPAQTVTRESSSDHPLYEPMQRPMRVFVFLARGFGARNWMARWTRGEIPGLNEKLPYGYCHAASENCIVQYSEDAGEGPLGEFVRLAIRHILGFDLVHAWRNRKALRAADIVWTHTELEHLAVLALWQFRRPNRRPKLIANSVWLFDRWHRFSAPRRSIYLRFLRQADLLAVMSPENLEVGRQLFPLSRFEMIPFGCDADLLTSPVPRTTHRPVRIVSLGNDIHRDWETLILAARQWPRCHLRIASRQLGRRFLERAPNIDAAPATSQNQVLDLYSWADIAVVPLKPNLHASGITAICEATLRGLPVVCTDTGGLRAYFSDDQVRYVPPHDSAALLRTLEELADDDQLRFTLTRRAQARILSAGLTSRAFAMRHYELSQQLLASRLAPALDSGLSDPVEPAWQPSSPTTP